MTKTEKGRKKSSSKNGAAPPKKPPSKQPAAKQKQAPAKPKHPPQKAEMFVNKTLIESGGSNEQSSGGREPSKHHLFRLILLYKCVR